MMRQRIWIGLLGAPVAWIAQMMLSESIANYACYPHREPLATPLFGHVPLTVTLIDLACLAIGVGCSWVTWSEWRRAKHESGKDGEQIIEEGRTRQGFFVMMSALTCFGFVVAILFTSIAVLAVQPCRPW